MKYIRQIIVEIMYLYNFHTAAVADKTNTSKMLQNTQPKLRIVNYMEILETI